MKETPILFSTPMVQAILNGTKTQTRRVATPVKDKTFCGGYKFGFGKQWCAIDYPELANTSKYGEPGNLLWVKETFYAYGYWKKNGLTKTGKQKWAFIDGGIYSYQDEKPTTIRKNSYRKVGWYKRPSLFMPKAAARLWLQITGIRVERLQTITEADAKAEGVEWSARQGYVNYISNHPSDICKYAASSFTSLWLKINGRESWDANPYVWVIEFKVISKTGKP